MKEWPVRELEQQSCRRDRPGFLCRLAAVGGGFAKAVDRFFDDQTVWANAIDTTIGKEQALGFIAGFPIPLAYRTAEDITITSVGDTVFAQRIDRFRGNADEVFLSMRLNGVFVIKDDKIAQWRDCVETVGFGAEVQVAAVCSGRQSDRPKHR